VLTGGGASLDGVAELAGASFSGPVRVGAPGDGMRGLVDTVRRPKFATAAGLVLYGARREIAEGVGGRTGGGASVNGVIKWVREWLADFF
jgi:cell division protein FtsA